MRAPVLGLPLPKFPWDGRGVRRVFALGPASSRAECFAAMTLLRPNLDICLIPDDSNDEAIAGFAAHSTKFLGLAANQIQIFAQTKQM